MNNGDGLRVVLWLSGCSHHCHNCQNPQTWNTDSGIPFDDEAKKELFQELEKDYISGITLSGGDPLNENNVKEVYQLLKEIKNNLPQKTVWLYTGYTFEQIKESYHKYWSHMKTEHYRYLILNMCDVLIDGRYIDTQRDITLKWRGSSNQRVIDVKKTLKNNKVTLFCD